MKDMERHALVDSKWLFPEAAEIVLRANDQYFQEMSEPSRRLARRELQRYGFFAAGWRTTVEISGKSIELDVLLKKDIPFSEPRVAIASGDYHFIWPHVENDGLLCLRTSADMIDHGAGVALTAFYLKETINLLQDSMAGRTREDFVTEFGSYWGRWIEFRKSRNGSFWLLSKPEPPSRVVYCAAFGNVHVIADSAEEGVYWARCYFPKEDIKDKRFKAAAFLWMDRPLMPDKYPKHNGDVANLFLENRCHDMLLSLVPDKPGDSIDVVFGFSTPNGPALGAIQLNEPIASQRYKKKPVYSRLKGKRPKSVSSVQSKMQYFSVSGKAVPTKVQRITREWVFERGGKGLNPTLDQARVCLIGCGSLGAPVAKHLVQSGVRKLVLIDPDTLSWDNIGRHLLGAAEVGKHKTSALKSHLETHLPAMLDIEVQPYRWQQIIADETKKGLISDSNVIVSTIGNWDAEATLNHAFNSFSQFPPVVFGWTEPFAAAGHVVSITGLGGCLTCGMTPKGRFKYAISRWEGQEYLRRAPACGETYQAYGIIDIAPIQSMIAQLTINVIMGNSEAAVHHAWIGRLDDIEEIGGRIWNGAVDYYGDLGTGYRLVEKQWHIDSSCRYKH